MGDIVKYLVFCNPITVVYNIFYIYIYYILLIINFRRM